MLLLCFVDLVVGAPRENGNAGAVYVFQGSNIGLLTEKSQVGSTCSFEV